MKCELCKREEPGSEARLCDTCLEMVQRLVFADQRLNKPETPLGYKIKGSSEAPQFEGVAGV